MSHWTSDGVLWHESILGPLYRIWTKSFNSLMNRWPAGYTHLRNQVSEKSVHLILFSEK